MPLILYTVLPGQFSCQFQNKNNIFQMELVSMVLLELNESVLIDGIQIRLNLGSCSICMIYFRGAVVLLSGGCKILCVAIIVEVIINLICGG